MYSQFDNEPTPFKIHVQSYHGTNRITLDDIDSDITINELLVKISKKLGESDEKRIRIVCAGKPI